MAKPASVPTWATDASFDDPGEDWDTEPNKVDPGAGKRADGWLPNEVVPADFLNHEQNAYGAWFTWLDETWDSGNEHIYDLGNNGPLRRTVIDPGHFDDWAGANGEWRTEFDVGFTDGKAFKPRFAGARCGFCLEDHLPEGALVQTIAMLVRPHQGNTGANRMSIAWYEQEEVYTVAPDVTLTGPNDQAFDDESDDLQLVTMAGVSIPITTQLFEPLGALSSRRNFVVIFASANTITDECLFSVIVLWDDAPGLRNY